MSAKANLQVYGDKYLFVDGDGVFVTGVDIDQVIAEFNAEDVLDALTFSDVVDYVAKVVREGKDE